MSSGFDTFPIGSSSSSSSSPPPLLPLLPLNSSSFPIDTLDEPISVTLMRDVKLVREKLSYVIFPRKSESILRNWDLWGPLFLCLTLAVLLSFTAPTNQAALVFSGVFVIVWCGAGVITLNSRLLGGEISFFQSVCVLGYCIFPLVCAEIIVFFIPLFSLKLVVVLFSFLWSTYASLTFLSDHRLEKRKILAVYPIFLFYFAIAWIILIS